MAIVFAYVFGQFLIIPVGQCFGSQSAPSFFSLRSDLQADIAMTGALHDAYPLQDLTKDIQLPLPPLPEELTPAIADTLNLPLLAQEQENVNNNSFVDDNGICVVASRIIQAIQQSLLLVFLLFGWPDSD
jgi:hypothetical protein